MEALINRYFDVVIHDCIEASPHPGCLLLNTIAEMGNDPRVAEIARHAVNGMQDDVARALAGVSGAGRPDSAIRAAAEHVVALSQTLIHLSKVGAGQTEPREIGRQAAAALDVRLAA